MKEILINELFIFHFDWLIHDQQMEEIGAVPNKLSLATQIVINFEKLYLHENQKRCDAFLKSMLLQENEIFDLKHSEELLSVIFDEWHIENQNFVFNQFLEWKKGVDKYVLARTFQEHQQQQQNGE